MPILSRGGACATMKRRSVGLPDRASVVMPSKRCKDFFRLISRANTSLLAHLVSHKLPHPAEM